MPVHSSEADLEAELERALELAAAEPGYRPGFFRLLLDALVWVLVEGGPRMGQSGVVTWLRNDGARIIPVFLSTAALKAGDHQAPRVAKVRCRDLLSALQSPTGILINPDSQANCMIEPGEVPAFLATGSPEFVRVERLAETADIQVAFRRIADPPGALVSSLIVLFNETRAVAEAHLVEMTAAGRPAVLLVALVLAGGGDEETITRAIAAVAQETYAGSLDVDVLYLAVDDATLRSVACASGGAFYRRAWHLPQADTASLC